MRISLGKRKGTGAELTSPNDNFLPAKLGGNPPLLCGEITRTLVRECVYLTRELNLDAPALKDPRAPLRLFRVRRLVVSF